MHPATHTSAAIEFLTLVAAGRVREAFERHVATDFRHHNPFFRGLRTGRIFQSVLAQVGQTVGRYPGAHVYFGPRMQWGYAAFGLPSPVGQPIWWHPGVSLASSDVGFYLDRWSAAEFDVLVFWYNARANVTDFTYMPQAFLDRIGMAYREDDSLSEMTLYFKREPR